jgi:hypothetical protein
MSDDTGIAARINNRRSVISPPVLEVTNSSGKFIRTQFIGATWCPAGILLAGSQCQHHQREKEES